MNKRYLVVCSRDAGSVDVWRERIASGRAIYDQRLRSAVNCKLWLIYFTDVTQVSIIKPDDDGTVIILGEVYRNDGNMPKLDHSEICAHFAQSASTPEDVWGNYVTIEKDHDVTVISRSPFSNLPCYLTFINDSLVITSDIAIIKEYTALKARVSVDQIVDQLLHEGLRSEKTCLTGVIEVLGGMRATVRNRDIRVEYTWLPRRYAPNRQPSDNYATSAQTVRRRVVAAARTLAAGHKALVLGVSGGLDSSIVAAALAPDTNLHCYTSYGSTPVRDERVHARLLTTALNLPLFEWREDPSQVDIYQSAAAHLPRPTARAFTQASDAAARELQVRSGATGFLSGGGGDNVFCYLQSAAPLIDHYQADGVGLPLAQTLFDIRRVTGSGILDIVRALRKKSKRRTRIEWATNALFLSPDAKSDLRPPAHPWLPADDLSLPQGHLEHVRLIMAVLNHLEGYSRELTHPIIYPLLSQPVVEACLKIPSWYWIAEGRNRAVARSAFKEMLPEKIISRSTKGTPSSFLYEILDGNRPAISEMVLGGWLRQNNVIDLTPVETSLRRFPAVTMAECARLMRLADIEAWITSLS